MRARVLKVGAQEGMLVLSTIAASNTVTGTSMSRAIDNGFLQLLIRGGPERVPFWRASSLKLPLQQLVALL